VRLSRTRTRSGTLRRVRVFDEDTVRPDPAGVVDAAGTLMAANGTGLLVCWA